MWRKQARVTLLPICKVNRSLIAQGFLFSFLEYC
jgi:hypothetical protein